MNKDNLGLKIAVFVVGVLAGVALGCSLANAAGLYTIVRGDTLSKIASSHDMTLAQLIALNPQFAKNPNSIFPGETVTLSGTPTPTPTPKPIPNPTPKPTPPPVLPPVIIPSPVIISAGETRSIDYTTAYGYPDNTPAGSDISNPVIHTSAGGTGTFADPITMAVGHTISGGKDTLDYSQGTKFYIPNLRRYFIVEDTCGDGNSPQNGPCHRLDTPGNSAPAGAKAWIDLWVGGTTPTKANTLSCEDAITDLHLVIQNPASNYVVVSGPVFNNTCATQYGDTVVTN